MQSQYKIDRLRLITYKSQKRKMIKDLRCRYLAKSQAVKCNGKNMKLNYVNFRGSHFKKVIFDGAEFFGCDFWGASFNNCSFKNAKISDCIFMSCRFKNCNFNDTLFDYTVFVNTGLTGCNDIDISTGTTEYKQYPKNDISKELETVLDDLKNNKNIRKNRLLHIPGNKYNELNIFLLLRKYETNELPKLLSQLNMRKTKNITTYKRLELELKTIKNML